MWLLQRPDVRIRHMNGRPHAFDFVFSRGFISDRA
jgi:hypothetical protein